MVRGQVELFQEYVISTSAASILVKTEISLTEKAQRLVALQLMRYNQNCEG